MATLTGSIPALPSQGGETKGIQRAMLHLVFSQPLIGAISTPTPRPLARLSTPPHPPKQPVLHRHQHFLSFRIGGAVEKARVDFGFQDYLGIWYEKEAELTEAEGAVKFGVELRGTDTDILLLTTFSISAAFTPAEFEIAGCFSTMDLLRF